jgi:hypothetical protein
MQNIRFSFFCVIILCSFLFLITTAANALDRDLIISRLDNGLIYPYPSILVQRNIGKSPAGETLTRFTLGQGDYEQNVLTDVNLPLTAVNLSVWFRAAPVSSGKHIALFADSHGWGGSGSILWGIHDNTTYTTHCLGPKDGFNWRVGFFHTAVRAPFRFRGFAFQGKNPKDTDGLPAIVEAGYVHVSYTPDDVHWLYEDLQPKSTPWTDGKTPVETLHLANLGAAARTFLLSVRLIERNRMPLQENAISLGKITLQPGQQKSLKVHIPFSLPGRCLLKYIAKSGKDIVAVTEAVSVVNTLDCAQGFRHWAAMRKWFSVPQRRRSAQDTSIHTLLIPHSSNGLSSVPLFPVMSRSVRVDKPYSLNVNNEGSASMTVLSTQLCPAWLFHTGAKNLHLFGDLQNYGEGAPTFAEIATSGGTKVISAGAVLDKSFLTSMAQPWIIVWFHGARGWDKWDTPYFVMLQHRPQSLKLNTEGLHLIFQKEAGAFAVMPLYGYAKLPQTSSQIGFAFPKNWSATDLQPWKWKSAIPTSVVDRANWWSRVLCRFPYNVHETYTIDHAKGSVNVQDVFDYVSFTTDWHTKPLAFAPLSPTLACAKVGGYPLQVSGNLKDAQYATLFGPYTGIVGGNSIKYRVNIGNYWMKTADPNLTIPSDTNSPARKEQAGLLNQANQSSQTVDEQTWDYKDENFVWYAQNQSNRYPGYLTGYTSMPLRLDRKSWMQNLTLYTLLDPSRYGMDERGQGLTRRYIDGPGIGNWGSSDWGDSGKLGADMILDAWAYAYYSGDYQTIADKWDIITSLNVTPATMSWLGVGRESIAEMGDEAPPQLALARLAYAVGDRQTYAAAVYWYSRELALHSVKDSGFTLWRSQFGPWHHGMNLPTETGTNLWGTNAAWVGGGFHTSEPGENQWVNFYVRFDDMDTLRFHRDHLTWLPQKVITSASKEELKGSESGDKPHNLPGGPVSPWLYFIRTVILARNEQDIQQALADWKQNDPYVQPLNWWAVRVATAWTEFPPKMEQLIPASEPSITDARFAQDQMTGTGLGMISQGDMVTGYTDSKDPSHNRKGIPPTQQWFWHNAPSPYAGVEWGDKWTFGSILPDEMSNAQPNPGSRNPVQMMLNEFSTLFTYKFDGFPIPSGD